MKPEDVRIEDTATLLVAKRKINEVIARIKLDTANTSCGSAHGTHIVFVESDALTRL